MIILFLNTDILIVLPFYTLNCPVIYTILLIYNSNVNYNDIRNINNKIEILKKKRK